MISIWSGIPLPVNDGSKIDRGKETILFKNWSNFDQNLIKNSRKCDFSRIKKLKSVKVFNFLKIGHFLIAERVKFWFLSPFRDQKFSEIHRFEICDFKVMNFAKKLHVERQNKATVGTVAFTIHTCSFQRHTREKKPFHDEKGADFSPRACLKTTRSGSNYFKASSPLR